MSEINSVSLIPGTTGYPAEEVYGTGVAGPPADVPPPSEVKTQEEKVEEKVPEEEKEEERVLVENELKSTETDLKKTRQVEEQQDINQGDIEYYLGQNVDIRV